MPARAAPVADHPGVERLGDALRAMRLTPETVTELLGEDAFGSPASRVPFLERLLPSDDPRATVLRVFFLGLPVSADALAAALPSFSPGLLAEVGLAAVEGGELRPLGRIVPHDELLLASDLQSRPEDPPDWVAGYTGSAAVVHSLTVRRHARRALDVGTGSGVHALLAAAHSDHVVATDVNPRALAYTSFNARLNGIANVETRLGSFFDAVGDERFDLVLCNPPFVISPESRYLFRDADAAGDDLSRDLVAGAAAHLEEGGFATLQVSWVGRDEEAWESRPAAWLDGRGCDAWIVRSHRHSPLRHAAAWNGDLRGQPEAYAAALDRWTAHARELGADWIYEGGIVMRRRTARRNWVRADQPSGERHGAASDQIIRVFAAMDALGERGPEVVRDLPLKLADTVRFEHTFAVRGRERAGLATRVRLDEGVRFSADVNPETAELLVLLEAHGTLRAALEALAGRVGLDEDARERLTTQAVEIVADMWASGLLVPRAAHEKAAERAAAAAAP